MAPNEVLEYLSWVMWVATAAVTTALLLLAVWMTSWFWWRPRWLECALRAQGLLGTRYRFPFGDFQEIARLNREARAQPLLLSHPIIPRVSPFLHQIINQYGKFCITWFGPIPSITILNPDLVCQIFASKFAQFEKQKIPPLGKLWITGLVTYEGDKWAKHSRIIKPLFHTEKLKQMQPAFSTCCSELIRRWEKCVQPGGTSELDVWPEFQKLTIDVISRTSFGCSYEDGRRIIELQTEQAKLFFQGIQTVFIPGFRFLPTPLNRRRKQIDREVRNLLRRMIEKRETAIKSGQNIGEDLLSLLIESNLKLSKEHGKSKNGGLTIEEIIEECKLFYIAGQETTSVLLNWTIVLLSMNPSWQERAREEVLQVFGENKPAFDSLNKLKIVNMILHEVLRLYPPVISLSRVTSNNVELGGITCPKGVLLSLPILHIHHDSEIWG